ncbi:hypothetical protein [Prevotella sp. 10(H)]|uniref:hypothetical protein n=1 Tax=Prevotella sp. 10(H) TaxID=1158294 RepID=UPI0004A7362F|nr:hypothetical protein [Prevotella sp. 10(H)]
MNKFSLLNLAFTFVILAIVLVINHNFYLTKTDFYSALISSSIISIQILFCLYYALKHLKEFTILSFVLLSAAILFQILVILFIINGILWSTDTGQWVY